MSLRICQITPRERPLQNRNIQQVPRIWPLTSVIIGEILHGNFGFEAHRIFCRSLNDITSYMAVSLLREGFSEYLYIKWVFRRECEINHLFPFLLILLH
jgi:hypothetical protein